MAELTETQLSQARQAVAKVFGTSDNYVLTTNILVTAAPFLQLPWDGPTEKEREFADFLCFERGCESALKDFVRRRNAALMPKPVVETLEEQLAGAKRACRLALNAFERNDAIDWAEVEKYAAPEFTFGFTGFEPMDIVGSDHMYQTSFLERPAPPREEFKKNPADIPQAHSYSDDARHWPVRNAIIAVTDDIIEGWRQGGCWPSSGDQCEYTNRILAALDGVKS